MLQNEFESLIGMNVTVDEYETANAVYMNACDMGKQSFCEDWKKHKDSEIIKALSDMANSLEERNESLADQLSEARNSEANRSVILAKYLIDKAEEYQDRGMAHQAVELIGMKEFIKYKLKMGYKLYSQDTDFILAELNKIEPED